MNWVLIRPSKKTQKFIQMMIGPKKMHWVVQIIVSFLWYLLFIVSNNV